MKKLLLLIAFIFVSCSSDTETITPTKTTTAMKVTEMRVLIVNYDTMVTISDTGYQKQNREFYSNNSSDCGAKLAGYETTQIGTLNGVKVQVFNNYRYTVECN